MYTTKNLSRSRLSNFEISQYTTCVYFSLIILHTLTFPLVAAASTRTIKSSPVSNSVLLFFLLTYYPSRCAGGELTLARRLKFITMKQDSPLKVIVQPALTRLSTLSPLALRYMRAHTARCDYCFL